MIINKSSKKIGTYQLIQPIGNGANGIVYKGLNNETGKSVAIKQVTLSPEQLRSVQSEIFLLRELNHEHIVKYIDAIQSENSLHIVLQFIEGGSLASLVKKYLLPENLVQVYIRQVLEGLEYLHQMGVVHRDIKGANILLTKDGTVKLADFGVAIRLNEDHKTFSLAGTPYWMAPEIIESKTQISTSCDIWSLGCTVIELMTGNPPYFDLMQFPALFRIVKDEHPPIPEVSEHCKDFLLKCFKKNPEQRLKASDLLRHVWLDSGNGTSGASDSTIITQTSGGSINIRQLIVDKNYQQLISCLPNIATKRIVYNHPRFVQLIQSDRNNEAGRSMYVLAYIKGDWDTLKYFATVGLIDSVLQSSSASNSRSEKLDELKGSIMLQIADACSKAADLSLFSTVCLKPLRRLFSLGQNDRICVDIVQRVLSIQIISYSHICYILAKEMILGYLFVYLQKIVSLNMLEEVSRVLSMVIKFSGVKQNHLCRYFKPCVRQLINMLFEFSRPDLLGKLARVLHSLSRDENLCDFMEEEGVVVALSQLLIRKLPKMELKDEHFSLISDVLKIVDNLSEEHNRRDQFLLQGIMCVVQTPNSINAICGKRLEFQGVTQRLASKFL